MSCTVTILLDNDAAAPDCETGWAFSCWVETHGVRLLFDTGWDGGQVIANAARFGVDLGSADAVFISHAHWDHLGGLPEILGLVRAPVFVPASVSEKMRAEIARRCEVRVVAEPTRVARGLRSTGEMGADPKEQSLLVDVEGGVLVITGCAHPGLEAILEHAALQAPVRGVLGGFHGFAELDQLAPLDLICPCHCTVEKQAILERFPERARRGGSGATICL